MKIYCWRIFILVLVVALTGCDKKEDDNVPVIQEESGAIFVTVVSDVQPVSGAVVTSEPEGVEGTTDVSGNLMINNVGVDIYHLFATKSSIGSGSKAVAVHSGDVSNVIIHLISGVFDGPMVSIFSVYPQSAGIGDTITVQAVANHNIYDDLSFEWSTNLDGVISNEGIGENGYAILKHAFDTPGQRTLTVTVSNSEGESNTDQVPINILELPDPVIIAPFDNQSYAPQLNWSATDVGNFNSYRVYRQGQSEFMLIETINDVNTTSYIDSDVDLDAEYNYRVALRLNNGFEVMSNTVSWQFGGEIIDIGTGLDVIMHHPTNPMIYGLDTDNNSLLFIDTELGQPVNTIYVGSIPSDMDFSLDHQLLYIANYGSTEISVVDLTSQSVQSTFFVEANIGLWDDNPYSLAVLADGLLAFSGPGTSSKINVVDITNGDNLFVTSGYYKTPYLTANADGTKLFVGESGNNWSEMHRFNVVDNELVLVQSSNDILNSERQVFITDNEEFAFFSRSKLLVNNLASNLGSFNHHIYAINSDGSRVLGENKIFNGNDFSIAGNLPASTKVSVFSNDNNSAYLYHEESTNLYRIAVE